jgi:hypothetical protein
LAHLLPFAYWAAYSESKLRLIGRFFTAYVFVSLFFIVVPSCRSFPLPLLSSLSSFLTYILFIMAKSTKSKAVKSSPKKSHAELSTIETKKTGRQRRKAATATTTTHEPQQPEASEDDELEEPATDTLTLKIPARVVWDKYCYVPCLILVLRAHLCFPFIASFLICTYRTALPLIPD